MLSHTFDVTRRGDEATVCALPANFESDNRERRHARFRRQAEQETAAEDAVHTPVGDTEKGSQDSAENSENTSEHIPKDTDELKEAAQQGEEQHAEMMNQTAKYVSAFL